MLGLKVEDFFELRLQVQAINLGFAKVSQSGSRLNPPASGKHTYVRGAIGLPEHHQQRDYSRTLSNPVVGGASGSPIAPRTMECLPPAFANECGGLRRERNR